MLIIFFVGLLLFSIACGVGVMLLFFVLYMRLSMAYRYQSLD